MVLILHFVPAARYIKCIKVMFFLVPTALLCHAIQRDLPHTWPSLSFLYKLPHTVKTTTEKALLICKVRGPKHIW